jgi:hypothetical protein
MNTTEHKFTALVCGHTGATGKALLDTLLDSPQYKEVIAIGRRESPRHKGADKLTQIVLPNMEEVAKLSASISKHVDAGFCCIGAGYAEMFKNDAKTFHAVDYVIATEFAKLSQNLGADFFSVITCEGVSPQAKNFMYRTKGETEEYLMKFARLALMHPKFVNREGDAQWFERIMSLNGLLGTKVSDMARAMAWASLKQRAPLAVYNVKDMRTNSAAFKSGHY